MKVVKIAVNSAQIRLLDKEAFVTFYNDDTVAVLVDCHVHSGALIRIPMEAHQYHEWRNRDRGIGCRLIQEIFPELNSEVREVLVTGMTPAEWSARLGGRKHSLDYLRKLGYEFEE